MTIENNDYSLKWDDSPEARERVFQMMLKFFHKLGHYTGESIQQSDSTYVEAPEILSDIAEKGFRFKQKWKE